jgi:glycine cleavage system transcriptional repressor
VREDGRMNVFAVTVLGRDRPGIVAETTAALADLGGNLEDSTMTLLRGRFAMLLLVRAAAPVERVRAALAGLTAEGALSVDVQQVPDPPDAPPAALPGAAPGAPAEGAPYVLSVHGADRPGIVSALTGEVAGVGGTVTDLSTRLTGELYLLLAEVLLPPSVDVDALAAAVGRTAEGLGVDVWLRPVETDDL